MAGKKQMRVDDELFFINIPNPKEVRKNLLESSQQIVEGMKSYEKYKKIKAEKLKKIDALKAITVQIRENAGKLRACLPTVKGLPEKARIEKMPHVTQIELEQLNIEIKKLEEELRGLK
ncbi:MAG: hypothetical protein AABX82_07125 [Nanoarchaeota archaeon]